MVLWRSDLICIVDDDESVREATKALLRSAGYQAQTFASAESLFSSGILKETECLILDVRMPGMDGLEMLSRVINFGFRIPVIFITAHADGRLRRLAVGAGAADLLAKPFRARDLLQIVESVLNVKAGSSA